MHSEAAAEGRMQGRAELRGCPGGRGCDVQGQLSQLEGLGGPGGAFQIDTVVQAVGISHREPLSFQAFHSPHGPAGRWATEQNKHGVSNI